MHSRNTHSGLQPRVEGRASPLAQDLQSRMNFSPNLPSVRRPRPRAALNQMHRYNFAASQAIGLGRYAYQAIRGSEAEYEIRFSEDRLR